MLWRSGWIGVDGKCQTASVAASISASKHSSLVANTTMDLMYRASLASWMTMAILQLGRVLFVLYVLWRVAVDPEGSGRIAAQLGAQAWTFARTAVTTFIERGPFSA